MSNSIIQRDREIFQQEKDHLLYTILDNRFFEPWRRGPSTSVSDVPQGSLELFITPTCNQSCEYCYLQKHINDLYPKDCNNKDLILKNLKHLLDWIIESKFNLHNLDLYSGEIWHTNYGLEVLDIIYEYILEKGLVLKSITIPTNGTFLDTEKQTIEIQNRIDAFSRVGCSMTISLSLDGKYLEDIERVRNDGTLRDDEYYERAFTFAKHNDYGFHPMLSAKSAKYWIKNFEWWLSMFKKYKMPIDRIMLLEVRNNDWEEEDIIEYQKFLRYLVDFTFNYHNGDLKSTVDDLFLLNQVYDTPNDKDYLWGEGMSYIPISLHDNKGYYGCTISTHLAVRLGDLAICPCHRTAYNKYLYGKFTQNEKGEITGIQANNPQMAINILMLNNRYAILGCDSCIFNKICLGTCKGQSVEENKDPFHNDPKVCDFLYRKYLFLFELFDEKGIMKWLEENLTKYHGAYSTLKDILEIWESVKEGKQRELLAESRKNIHW